MSPYIHPILRENSRRAPADAGGLAYAITALILDYMKPAPERFAAYAEVVGVLECVRHELMRRRLDPYEDAKLVLNGDVF